MSKNNWDIFTRLKFFFAIFTMTLVFYVVLGVVFLGFNRLNELNIDWRFIVTFSLIYSVFGASRYKKVKIEIPIEDKASFIVLLRDCIEHIGLKIISENNAVFILKPKYSWLDLWLCKEKVTVTVEENQAVLMGPDYYIRKIKIMLDAFL